MCNVQSVFENIDKQKRWKW